MPVPTIQATATAVVVADPVPQQAPQLAPSVGQTAAGATTLVVICLGFFIWYWVKHKKAKAHHMIVAFAAGALLSGSMLGVMAVQTSGSLGAGLMTMLGTVTGKPAGQSTTPSGGQP